MPLIEAVPVVPATELGSVHFIGVGGAGMSGIAAAFVDAGIAVSGSDGTDSEPQRHLSAAGISTFVGHDAAQLGDAETVVVSSAIGAHNGELAAARQRGLQILQRSAALASLMTRAGTRGVAVGGTHGKTTTSAWIAVALTAAGRDPSYVIGAPLTAAAGIPAGTSAHLGKGPEFVVEADESDGTFLQYPAEIVVVTNVEADHLDNWLTPQAYAEGFTRFVTGEQVRTVVLNLDDPGAAALVGRLDQNVITYGEAGGADVQITELDLGSARTKATLRHRDGTGGTVRLSVLGRHNASNAAAAYAVARAVGIDDVGARRALEHFAGTSRRFQLVGEVHQIRVYDDYAHNPTKVRAALTAARAAVGRGRLIVCFQPHLYSRTRDFADRFAESLSLADEVVVMDVYGAREEPIPQVTGELIAKDVITAKGKPARYVPDWHEAARATAGLAKPWDLVLTVGAGDVTEIGPAILTALQERR
ncbi:MAG: UDP-N-acetylmuramate--L-alanine ligase [Propionibacteriales bacterium]|nr:UDP-N-acetylmuramate--L-alanine ligase [Propionibacteriales bacterium]